MTEQEYFEKQESVLQEWKRKKKEKEEYLTYWSDLVDCNFS